MYIAKSAGKRAALTFLKTSPHYITNTYNLSLLVYLHYSVLFAYLALTIEGPLFSIGREHDRTFVFERSLMFNWITGAYFCSIPCTFRTTSF